MKLIAPTLLLAICYLILFGYVILSYGSLPAKVASHFDLAGQPNGWMDRNLCVAFTLALGLLVPAAVIGTMTGATRIPVSFVNLPHRDYWLVPERLRATLALLRCYSLWFAALNVLFVTGLHWLIVQANLTPPSPHLSLPALALVAGSFLACAALWVALLLRHFSKLT